MSSLLARYSYYLVKHPLKTKMVTSGTLAAFGDTFCQYMENSKRLIDSLLLEYEITNHQEWNWKRTRNFTLMGTFFSAPLLHLHFSKLLPWVAPQVNAAGLAKKLLVD